MKRMPSEYLRRFSYDTIGHQINLNLVRLAGADRVVLGSDTCFDMGLTEPGRHGSASQRPEPMPSAT